MNLSSIEYLHRSTPTAIRLTIDLNVPGSPPSRPELPKVRCDEQMRSFFALLPIEHMFDRLDFLWKTLVTPFPYRATWLWSRAGW